jgi:hypothetical protein
MSIPGDEAAPYRQIRAVHTDRTVVVYQAYPAGIADAALAAGTFLPPFKRQRATWIKPSFLWMAYRSGWAAKAGQERVLAVEITRTGFDWALEHACLSHYEPGIYREPGTWRHRMDTTSVRIQWDPERDLRLQPLRRRSIQIGLSGEAVTRYVEEWIVSISDTTPIMRQIRALVAVDATGQARALLPAERPYPVPPELSEIIGASRNAYP